MKKPINNICLISIILLMACSSKQGKSDGNKTMTVTEANNFLSAEAGNSGKEITVQGYVWSVRDIKEGAKSVALGDEKLAGVKTTPFLCKFTKDKAPQEEQVKRDALVVITGILEKGYKGAELANCKLIAVKN